MIGIGQYECSVFPADMVEDNFYDGIQLLPWLIFGKLLPEEYPGRIYCQFFLVHGIKISTIMIYDIGY